MGQGFTHVDRLLELRRVPATTPVDREHQSHRLTAHTAAHPPPNLLNPRQRNRQSKPAGRHRHTRLHDEQAGVGHDDQLNTVAPPPRPVRERGDSDHTRTSRHAVYQGEVRRCGRPLRQPHHRSRRPLRPPSDSRTAGRPDGRTAGLTGRVTSHARGPLRTHSTSTPVAIRTAPTSSTSSTTGNMRCRPPGPARSCTTANPARITAAAASIANHRLDWVPTRALFATACPHPVTPTTRRPDARNHRSNYRVRPYRKRCSNRPLGPQVSARLPARRSSVCWRSTAAMP